MDPIHQLRDALSQRYRVERLLGEGGMALVYLAQDLKHHRPVAIKVLRPEVSATLGRERFLREIETAAGLNHPNILPLHDSGDADGLLFFVMPFVEGPSLRERLDQEPRLSLDEAVRITREIGNALEFAHAHGLVHRDIKPENILFQAGHALVGDFGIAQATSGSGERLTRTGTSVGTFTYMSPEQLGGEGEVDGRADLYALGCLLHEMLAGESPFDAPTPQASLAKKLTGRTAELAVARPDVPPTVAQVLRKTLSIRPEDRFDSAGTFTQALEVATTRAAVEADALQRTRKKRNRLVAQVAGVILLAAGTWWVSTLGGGPSIQRLAVLPLLSALGEEAQDYYLQGLHEDLVLELSRAGMRVIAPASVARYARNDRPVHEIAEELGVDGIIQGQATLSAGFVGLRLTLVDGVTDEILRTESFREAAKDINTLYRKATRTTAAWVGLELSPEVEARLAEVQEVDPQVYDALLQARFHWQKLTEEGIDRAESYFRLALSRDSTSAEAWFGLGQVWFMKVQQGLVSREEAEENGTQAIERARALDPSLSKIQAQNALELAWGAWDWGGAVNGFQSALESDPTDSVTRAYYSQVLFFLNRNQEALAEIERAVELDPFHTLIQGIYAMDLNFLHRYEDAASVLNNAMDREPDHPIILSTLRTTYHLMGQWEDALQMWRASYLALDDLEAAEALDAGYAEGGYLSALGAVANLLVERSRTTFVTPWQIGTLFARGQQPGPALDYLEQALELRDQNMPYITVDPIFDDLRDEPRFQAMIERLGLPR